ncbi:unnamed protein product [Spodoptera exigua]|uniref:Uncharacterized protein LOC111353895 n=4 Tax=Spodoptera TaxID=7106 RepID=A0A9J7IPL2_SPOLT|nr:uncharacterized protein LOC111353895 [Spodoptera litura]XP_035444041.1 uncharacterized protein LOC118271890 [Spodoptera frugiperda]CAH0694547.1 unnamed protein product [Spodoptera exigua]
MANLSIFVPVLLLALFIKEGEPVRCWTCSSDLNPLCNDPFLAGRSDNSYLFRLENCDANAGATYPHLTSSKSVCKKMKKYINGQLVVSRGCTWKRADDYSTQCPSASNGPYEVTSFCETCEYDGCNGAATISKTIALLAAPLTLLLFK